MHNILEAAVIGKKFQFPIISRLLLEMIDPTDKSSNLVFDKFFIWAIGDVEHKVDDYAKRTASQTQCLITDIDQRSVNIMKEYASKHWAQLQDLHLRNAQMHVLFRKRASKISTTRFATHAGCSEEDFDIPQRIRQQLLHAQTVEEIMSLGGDYFGLKCIICRAAAMTRFGDLMHWAYNYAFVYERVNDGV